MTAVAGAGGPAGRAALLRLAEAGATVVGADNDPPAEANGNRLWPTEKS